MIYVIYLILDHLVRSMKDLDRDLCDLDDLIFGGW